MSKYLDDVRTQELIDETKRRLDTKVDKSSSPYIAGGSVTFENLPAATVTNCGLVYNITNDFETTADFIEGAGIKCNSGTDVAIVKVPNSDPAVYKYNIFSGNAVIESITTSELETMWKDDGTIILSIAGTPITSPSAQTVASGSSLTVNVDSASGVISVASSDTDTATASISGDVITISGVAAGDATITVTAAEAVTTKKAEFVINLTVS